MENVKSIREKLGLSIEDASHFVDKQKALWKKPPNHVSGPSKYKSRKIKDIAKTTIQSYRPLSIKHEDSVPFELLFAQLKRLLRDASTSQIPCQRGALSSLEGRATYATHEVALPPTTVDD